VITPVNDSCPKDVELRIQFTMNYASKISLMLVTTCGSTLAFAGERKCSALPAVPICTVLANAAKYDGNEIVVSGRYRPVIHGSILMGYECSQHDEVNLRGTPKEKDDKNASKVLRSFYKRKQNRFQSVDEVLRGRFRVARQGECFGEDCWSYELEITELLCAEVPKQP
jgi:hypothetical protein